MNDPFLFFFFQAEDGIRDTSVTGVQTCALPILSSSTRSRRRADTPRRRERVLLLTFAVLELHAVRLREVLKIGRASCRERVGISGVDGGVQRKSKGDREYGRSERR